MDGVRNSRSWEAKPAIVLPEGEIEWRVMRYYPYNPDPSDIKVKVSTATIITIPWKGISDG